MSGKKSTFFSVACVLTLISFSICFVSLLWILGIFLNHIFQNPASRVVISGYSLLAENSNIRGFLAAIIISFPIFATFFLYVHNALSKMSSLRESPIRKALLYTTLTVGSILIVFLLISITSILLNMNIAAKDIIKCSVQILLLTPIILYTIGELKATDEHKIKTYLILFIFMILVMTGLIYGFTKIGSPFLNKKLLFDQNSISDIEQMSWNVERFANEQNELPKSLNDVLARYSITIKNQVSDYKYFKTSGTSPRSYQICADFKLGSALQPKYGYESVSNFYEHGVGEKCFDYRVSVVPLCKTLGTKMIVGAGGAGQIGCDILTTGPIDLSESYCESQTTHQKAYLTPDVYNRTNWYYATLTGLEMNEKVRVFAYSNNKGLVECLPILNQ